MFRESVIVRLRLGWQDGEQAGGLTLPGSYAEVLPPGSSYVLICPGMGARFAQGTTTSEIERRRSDLRSLRGLDPRQRQQLQMFYFVWTKDMMIDSAGTAWLPTRTFNSVTRSGAVAVLGLGRWFTLHCPDDLVEGFPGLTRDQLAAQGTDPDAFLGRVRQAASVTGG